MAPLSAPRSPQIEPRRCNHLPDAFRTLSYAKYVRRKFRSEWFKTAGWTPWPGMRDVFFTQHFVANGLLHVSGVALSIWSTSEVPYETLRARDVRTALKPPF
eukprot:5519343-Prymnesium_polylepis.1